MLRRLTSINQKGQATIEYVLVLVIVIMMGLGIIWKFNSAFRTFALSYFGQYLDCLLANGELPSISSGKPGTCDAQFTAFDLASGRSPIDPYSSGSNSGGNSRGGDYGKAKNSQSSSGSKSSDSSSSGDNGSGPRGSASSRKSSIGSSPSSSKKNNSPGGLGNDSSGDNRIPAPSRASTNSPFGGRGNSPSGDDSGKSPNGDKEKFEAGSGGSSNSSRFGSRADIEDGRLRFVPSGSQSGSEGGEETLRPNKVSASERDATSSGQRIPIAKGSRKIASDNELDASMALPDFLRYLVIAAIIIALVLFLGGQALQISKGQDSGGS
jgi:hypothetical protein